MKKGGQTVYFGDLGHNAETLLGYFERNGGRRCEPTENPYVLLTFSHGYHGLLNDRAEYMLDVIGAGATATTEFDWYTIWTKSPEITRTLGEIGDINTSGSQGPAIGATFRSEFPTPWSRQLIELVKRGAVDHFRNPVYIIAKLVLNIFAGLFIGFSFFKNQQSLQGAQNKLFVRQLHLGFSSCLISLVVHLHVADLEARNFILRTLKPELIKISPPASRYQTNFRFHFWIHGLSMKSENAQVVSIAGRL